MPGIAGCTNRRTGPKFRQTNLRRSKGTEPRSACRPGAGPASASHASIAGCNLFQPDAIPAATWCSRILQGRPEGQRRAGGLSGTGPGLDGACSSSRHLRSSSGWGHSWGAVVWQTSGPALIRRDPWALHWAAPGGRPQPGLGSGLTAGPITRGAGTPQRSVPEFSHSILRCHRLHSRAFCTELSLHFHLVQLQPTGFVVKQDRTLEYRTWFRRGRRVDWAGTRLKLGSARDHHPRASKAISLEVFSAGKLCLQPFPSSLLRRNRGSPAIPPLPPGAGSRGYPVITHQAATFPLLGWASAELRPHPPSLRSGTG